LIEYWEHLAARLQEDGTWYGADRCMAIQLRGLSACVDHLYFDEDAYWTWVWALAAQPNPKDRDIELILRTDVIRRRIQDKDIQVWRRDPEECRASMHKLVDEVLPPLRELESELRTRYEEPARAAARERALARVSKDEIQLLRELRSHERS